MYGFTAFDYAGVSKYKYDGDIKYGRGSSYGCISLFDVKEDHMFTKPKRFNRALYKLLHPIWNWEDSLARNSVKALEVGAGTGAVMYFLSNYCSLETVHGVEQHKPYCDIFDEMKEECFPSESDIKMFNVNAFSFEKYGEYDLIFCYKPIRRANLYEELVAEIGDKMKSGAYFVDPYYDRIREPLRHFDKVNEQETERQTMYLLRKP